MTDDSGRHTLDTFDHASQRTCIVGIHCPLSAGNPSGGIEKKKKKTGRLNFKCVTHHQSALLVNALYK